MDPSFTQASTFSNTLLGPSLLTDGPNRVRNAASGLINRVFYGKWRQKPAEIFRNSNTPATHCAGNVTIWLLGRSYLLEENDKSAYFNFLVDFRSRIWLSYRDNFSPLLNSMKVSDCGWGCMLRCAQMMIAQGVVLQTLGRDWRLGSNWKCSEVEPIIRLFEDCEDAPLGIHSIVKIASQSRDASSTQNANFLRQDEVQSSEKNVASNSKDSLVVGRWFSPSEAISLLKDAVYSSSSPIISRLKFYLSVDMNVVVDELVELSDNWKYSIFLAISLRLGTKHINKTYYDQLKSLFSMEQFCGAIGGRPKRAFYFIGYVDDHLYYLDPHTVQKYQPLESALNSNPNGEENNVLEVEMIKEDVEEKKWMSFHSLNANSLHLEKVDPSFAVGFLLKSKEDLDCCIDDFVLANVVEYKSSKNHQEPSTLKTPFFTIFESRELLSHKQMDHSNYVSESSPLPVVNVEGFEVI